MAKSLLSINQKNFLSFFSKQKSLYNLFYLTGGTALSEFYLRHRYSEDLDFFSEKEFEIKDILLLLESNKKSLHAQKIEFTQSFNRNIYQLLYPDNIFLKIEFTYFPFKRIDVSKAINNISIDSLLDIAVNKLFTIYQNPRGRDFFDLFYILNKDKSLSIKKLIKLARIKFDTNIDYLQLGTNFLKVIELFDDPILKEKKSSKSIGEFFILEAKKLKEKILK